MFYGDFRQNNTSKVKIMNKTIRFFLSLIIGLINALFGAGGGLIAVPLFRRNGLSQKEAQASAISVILPLTVISTAIYLYRGYFKICDALGYIPFGIIGSMIGPSLMKKIPDKLLKKAFALFMIYSGINMIMR